MLVSKKALSKVVMLKDTSLWHSKAKLLLVQKRRPNPHHK
jgi:hypothetical protein